MLGKQGKKKGKAGRNTKFILGAAGTLIAGKAFHKWKSGDDKGGMGELDNRIGKITTDPHTDGSFASGVKRTL